MWRRRCRYTGWRRKRRRWWWWASLLWTTTTQWRVSVECLRMKRRSQSSNRRRRPWRRRCHLETASTYLYCVTLKRHSVLKSFSPFSFKVNSTVATDKFYSLRFLTMLHNCYVIIRFHNLNTLSSQKTFRLTFLCSEEFQVLFCEIFVRLFSA